MQAQPGIKNQSKKNIIFFEFLGNGVFLSVNYERFVLNNLSVRSGFGTAFIMGTTIPLMINYYIGNERKLELGIGLVYGSEFDPNSFLDEPGSIYITSTIGHAFHPIQNNIILRFTFSPFYNPQTNKITPYGGISIGLNF